MFKIKFETRDYKYFLKLGDNEVCLSSETPEDDDIKDIVNRALEAYHKYQGDKFQQYLDQCYLSDIVNAKDDKQCESENKTNEFQIDQKVIIVSDSIYNLDRGVIIGFDGEEVLVKIYGYHTHNFAKTSLYVGDIDSRIKAGVEVIFNGEYATIKKIKLVDEKIVYDLKVSGEVVTIQPNELVFAKIDENEKGIFVQINDSSKDYDKWYGRIQYRIIQLNSYIVNIRHNTQNILIKSKNITEIDIKNNKNDIQVNDMIKTVSHDGRMLFSHRYGIVRCHTGWEYYIDFGNELHHYKQDRFNKVNISK